MRTNRTNEQTQNDMNNQLLKKYSESEPQSFIQLEGYTDNRGTAICPDEDGHTILGGKTCELMDGADVRVLIVPGTPKQTVLLMLSKMQRYIKENEWLSAISGTTPETDDYEYC